MRRGLRRLTVHGCIVACSLLSILAGKRDFEKYHGVHGEKPHRSQMHPLMDPFCEKDVSQWQ